MSTLDKFGECLDDMSVWASDIASQWNGDESGLEEERAMQAGYVGELIENLRDELKQLGDS